MTTRSRESPVAIVGYSYRMPGGIREDSDFWRLLRNREIVQEPITDRYGRGYRPIGRFSGPGRFASRYEGLILEDGEKLIDPKLFGLSQDEVLAMDPQVRMLLNCSWETCERVGWGLHSLHNSATGVFIGAQVPPVASWRPMHGAGPFDVTTLSLAMLANRVSYHFNLMGPSITYCTACSASLTALHSAMTALQKRGLRTGSRRVGQLSWNPSPQRFIQCAGRDQSRWQMPLLRRRGQRLHPLGGRVRLRAQAARRRRKRRR